MIVRRGSIAELEAFPEFPALLAEYAAESAIDGMPPPAAKMEAYRHLETLGMLSVFEATESEALVGFLTVLIPVLPHYGIPVAVCESFFVAAAHRKSMAGLKLLVAGEERAKGLGSPGFLVSAPMGGKLAELLPRCEYVETNRVFFKKAA